MFRPENLCPEWRELLVTVTNARDRHQHRKYRHDRTTEDGTTVIKAELLQNLLVRCLQEHRYFKTYNTNLGVWDLGQIGVELGLLHHVKGMVQWGHDIYDTSIAKVKGKRRVPAQLIVDLLHSIGSDREYLKLSNKYVVEYIPLDAAKYINQPKYVDLVDGDTEVPGVSWAARSGCIVVRTIAKHESVVTKNPEAPHIFGLTADHVIVQHDVRNKSEHDSGNCPHSLSREEVETNLRDCALWKCHNNREATAQVNRLLQTAIEVGFAKGPLTRFHVVCNTYGGKQWCTILDRERLDHYDAVNVFDPEQRSPVKCICADEDNEAPGYIYTQKNYWVYPPGQHMKIESPTEPFGTFCFELPPEKND